MFVRFRQTKTRLQASLIRPYRVGGDVRHEHIASLGTVDSPPTVAGRLVFWQSVHERMARLGNRLDAPTQAKLLGDVHARVPMVTADEQRALQAANAKADAETWDTIADMHAETAEGHTGLVASAERTKAAAAAQHAEAAEEAARAKDRIARIERGEDVAGGLGKPLTVADVIGTILTKAEIANCMQTRDVAKAFGFDTMAKELHEAMIRAERRKLRAMHRRISDKP